MSYSRLKLGRSIIWRLVGFIVIHHGFLLRLQQGAGVMEYTSISQGDQITVALNKNTGT